MERSAQHTHDGRSLHNTHTLPPLITANNNDDSGDETDHASTPTSLFPMPPSPPPYEDHAPSQSMANALPFMLGDVVPDDQGVIDQLVEECCKENNTRLVLGNYKYKRECRPKKHVGYRCAADSNCKARINVRAKYVLIIDQPL